MEQPCNRHDEITYKLGDYDKRIRRLEEMYTSHEQQNKSIFRQLDKIDSGIENINKRIATYAGSLVMVLAGFLLWYIQEGG